MFLDLNLGDGTGFDVLRWMRAERRFVPTAVMTAFRLEFSLDEAIELGAAAYVDQPLSVDGLIALAGSLTRPMSTLDDPNQLHIRVCAGDPGALECLGAAFLRELPRRLARAFPHVPPDLVEDAVSTACVEYVGGAAPRFDARKGRSVMDFVYTIAWRNLRDRLQSELSRANREHRWVAEQPHPANPPFDIPVAAFDVWTAIMAVTKDQAERRAAAVWLDGGNSDRIATALGLDGSDAAGRRRGSKQFKDRLIKRLSRFVRQQT
jgi:CheY-like chemotaxis protein